MQPSHFVMVHITPRRIRSARLRDAPVRASSTRAPVAQNDDHHRDKDAGHRGVDAIIPYQPLKCCGARGSRHGERLLGCELRRVREEADIGRRAKNLFHPGRHRDRDQPAERSERDPGVASLALPDHRRGRDAQRDRRQHLVGDSEQRP